jgi:hypothetical protein
MNIAMTQEHQPGDFLSTALRRLMERFVFLFTPNPTRKWMRNPDIDLILDLDTSTFSGIGLGDAYASVSFLGPCDEFTRMTGVCVDENGRRIGKPTKSYTLQYHSDGTNFGVDKKFSIESFAFYVLPDAESPQSKPYAGKLIWNRQEVGLMAIGDVDSFRSIFGSPEVEHEFPEDDDPNPEARQPYGRYFSYDRPDASWLVFFDRSGRTVSMYVSQRIGASPSQTDSQESGAS